MEPLRADDPRSIGSYRLLGRLGSGGMGRVYLGRSAGGRTVAVKAVHPHFALDQNFRDRFAREVAAARRVGGAWTAPVLDADPVAEVPWVATGYVAGPDLQQVVGDLGALPAQTVRALGSGLAEALAAVHALGLVHRDVKPSNVLLTLDGPRLIDFGIARATDATAELTATGAFIGSPGYMSPEQVLGRGELGPPSDVFALGAVLAFAAGGHPPFPGTSTAQLLYLVVHEQPELDAVPAGLRELIAACLSKKPAARPGPAAVVAALTGGRAAAALIGEGWLPAPVIEGVSRRAVQLLDLEPGATQAPPPGPDGTPAPATTGSVPPPPAGAPGAGPTGPGSVPHDGRTAPDGPPAGPGRRPRRVLAGALAVVVAGGLAVGGYLAVQLGGDDGDGVTAGGTGTAGTTGEEKPPAADQLPAEYVGTWRGQLTMIAGLPAGEMVITLRAGAIGDEVGSALHTPPIAISQCVDRLTLHSLDDDRLTFDALVDAEQSTPGTCSQSEFQVVLIPDGEDALRYVVTHPDSAAEGLLERDG